jgi:hypothetical protein
MDFRIALSVIKNAGWLEAQAQSDRDPSKEGLYFLLPSCSLTSILFSVPAIVLIPMIYRFQRIVYFLDNIIYLDIGLGNKQNLYVLEFRDKDNPVRDECGNVIRQLVHFANCDLRFFLLCVCHCVHITKSPPCLSSL